MPARSHCSVVVVSVMACSHCSVVVYFWQLCSIACSHCSVVVYFWQLSHVLWLGGFCDMVAHGGPAHAESLFCGCLFLAVM